MFLCGIVKLSLTVRFGVIGSSEQIVDGNVEIVRKSDQSFVVGFPFAGLVSADAVLVQMQIHCQFQLRNALCFPNFFQPYHHIHTSEKILSEILDTIIPLWYNIKYPVLV